jgi:hypothetical protein
MAGKSAAKIAKLEQVCIASFKTKAGSLIYKDSPLKVYGYTCILKLMQALGNVPAQGYRSKDSVLIKSIVLGIGAADNALQVQEEVVLELVSSCQVKVQLIGGDALRNHVTVRIWS